MQRRTAAADGPQPRDRARCPAHDFKDAKHFRTTDCTISRFADLKGTVVDLEFELVTVGQRRTMDITKTGRVYLLLLEKFSMTALKRGIRGPTALTHGLSPYDPVI
jgi:hypothetical protein